jgi:opacity protein-like surface antigen
VESEYDGSNSSLQALGIIGDVIYTCDTGEFWRPYIGVGAGAMNLRLDQAPPITGSDWGFGYQGMAGIAFDVDDKHAIVLGYRYQMSNDVEIKGVSPVEYASHNFSIGFVFD